MRVRKCSRSTRYVRKREYKEIYCSSTRYVSKRECEEIFQID